MDWLRWHHGTVDEAKLRLAAKRAGARMCEAVAMWAICMETASQSDPRGSCAALDFDVIDCAQDFPEGTAARLYAAFQGLSRPLIDPDGNLPRWEQRQPKREREDHGAVTRKRKQREREREGQGGDARASLEDAGASHVTPCHAMSRQEKPRGEEIREELSSTETLTRGDAADADARPADHVYANGFEGNEPRPMDACTRTRIAVVATLRRLSIDGATAFTDDLRRYVAAGGTAEHVEQVAGFARCAGKGAIYVLRAATSDLTNRAPNPSPEGRALVVGGPHTAAPMSKTLQAVAVLEKFK